MFPVLGLDSLRTAVHILQKDFLSDGLLDAFTHSHGCLVRVWEALVDPLPHEHPGVVGKGALDDLVVVLFQLFIFAKGLS